MKVRLALPVPANAWIPLMIDRSGRPVYLARGGEPGEDDGADDEGGSSDADDSDDDDEDTGDSTKNKKVGESAEDRLAAVEKKLRLSDKRAQQAESKLQEAADKDKSELEVATRKLEEATKKNADLEVRLKDQALVNAFALAETGITWTDKEDALDLARRKGFLEDVQDDEGVVDAKALVKKLQAFAKAKPHMVKSGGTDEDETPPAGETGSPVGSGRRTKKAPANTEAELKKRYSALRN